MSRVVATVFDVAHSLGEIGTSGGQSRAILKATKWQRSRTFELGVQHPHAKRKRFPSAFVPQSATKWIPLPATMYLIASWSDVETAIIVQDHWLK